MTVAMNEMRSSPRGIGGPFLMTWLGQTIASIGMALSGFAMGISVLQHTGHVLQFAGMGAVAIVPALLIAPWAGNLVDRFDRRYIILVSDMISALATAALVLALWCGIFHVWYLFALRLIGSVAGSFSGPAYQALLTSILPKDQMSRALGLMGISGELIGVSAPLAGGALMGSLGLPAIVLIQLVLFCFGTALVFRVFSALAPLSVSQDSIHKLTGLENKAGFADTLHFFREHKLMLTLFCYTIIQANMVGLVTMLIAPLILASYPVEWLGFIMTFAGLGSLLGSSVLVAIRLNNRLLVKLILSDAIVASCTLAAGIETSIIAYVLCVFTAFFAGAFSTACLSAVWMRKTPSHRRGRIFALLHLISMISGPAMALLGGFLADKVFGPALEPGSPLSFSVGRVVGTGEGRGLAAVFILSGFLGLLLCLAAALSTQFRKMDCLLPDAV